MHVNGSVGVMGGVPSISVRGGVGMLNDRWKMNAASAYTVLLVTVDTNSEP